MRSGLSRVQGHYFWKNMLLLNILNVVFQSNFICCAHTKKKTSLYWRGGRTLTTWTNLTKTIKSHHDLIENMNVFQNTHSSLNKKYFLLIQVNMTLHCCPSWLGLFRQRGKQMLAQEDGCVIWGGKGLVKGRPWCGVRQDDIQTFILFLWLMLPTQPPKTVQHTQVYQHLKKTQQLYS